MLSTANDDDDGQAMEAMAGDHQKTADQLKSVAQQLEKSKHQIAKDSETRIQLQTSLERSRQVCAC